MGSKDVNDLFVFANLEADVEWRDNSFEVSYRRGNVALMRCGAVCSRLSCVCLTCLAPGAAPTSAPMAPASAMRLKAPCRPTISARLFSGLSRLPRHIHNCYTHAIQLSVPCALQNGLFKSSLQAQDYFK